MHPEAMAYLRRTLEKLPPARTVVDMGGRNVNGTPRELFPAGVRYTAVDIRAGDGVDVVADAATYTPADAPDLVLCCEVAEHTPQAAAIVANAYRMLAPGGWFVLTAAGYGRPAHSAVDGLGLRKGEHYRNIGCGDLHDWLRGAGFRDITIEVDDVAHDIRAVAVKPRPN